MLRRVQHWHLVQQSVRRKKSYNAFARELSSTKDDEEESVAQYWRDMERRVLNRKPVPRGQGPSGRGPRKKAEIDYWAEEGMFEFNNAAKSSQQNASVNTAKHEENTTK